MRRCWPARLREHGGDVAKNSSHQLLRAYITTKQSTTSPNKAGVAPAFLIASVAVGRTSSGCGGRLPLLLLLL